MTLFLRAICTGLLAASVSCVTPAMAQTAGQITEDDYSPPLQRMTGSLVFSGAPGLAAPAGADRLSIQLSDVSLQGALPGTGAETEALRRRLTGKRIAVSEIFAAAADLEAAYAREGYVLARVVIPAQTLVDGGALRLSVVNGFVEKIDTAAVPPALRGRIAGLTDPLIGRPGLRMNEIERRLLLAGDVFGVALGSALSQGGEPGGTVIILDPQFRSTTGFVGFDNTYSDRLGPLNLSAGVELNGWLGRGEVFYFRASGNPGGGSDGWFSENPRLRTIAGGAVFPIGNDGLTFGIEAANSRTKPETSGATTTSEFERVSLRLFYPVIRTVKRNLSVQAALDIQSDRQDLVTGIGDFGLYLDKTRVLRLSADAFRQFDDGGALDAGIILSAGFDGLGARSAADVGLGVPLSRDGADADFRKLEVSFRYRRPLAGNWGISLSGQAQTSFGEPLLSGEQFGITTSQGLSAFDQGDLSGDSGWLVRGEVSRSFQTEAYGKPLLINPYLFAAAGEVKLENPTALERPSIAASSFGLGVDLLLVRDPRFSSASLRVEYGKGNRNDDGEDPERFTIVGSFRF